MVEHSSPRGEAILPASGRLLDAIGTALTDEQAPPERLAEAVRAYALEAYAREISPERMVVSLKALVAAATEHLDPRARANFVTALIPFALEGYYLDSWVRRTGDIPHLRRPPGSDAPAESR